MQFYLKDALNHLFISMSTYKILDRPIYLYSFDIKRSIFSQPH